MAIFWFSSWKKKFELKEKGHEPSRTENTSAWLGLITSTYLLTLTTALLKCKCFFLSFPYNVCNALIFACLKISTRTQRYEKDLYFFMKLWFDGYLISHIHISHFSRVFFFCQGLSYIRPKVTVYKRAGTGCLISNCKK